MMKKLYKSIFILMIGVSVLEAKQGLSQKHLVDFSPDPQSSEIKQDAKFSFTFDSNIIEKSIKPHTVILKKKRNRSNKKRVEGSIEIDEKRLTFIPSQSLEKGLYRLTLKPIHLEREVEEESKKRPHAIHTKPIHFQFKIEEKATATVVALVANPTKIEIEEHKTIQLAITAKYSDNSMVDVTQIASYHSSDSSVDVEKGVITSSDAGTATITISYEDKTISIPVEVYEVIEGHRLPPEPKNPDATLLGVDVNNNGVRDEVERWIYKEMTTYHYPKIERVIAMQQAKADQMALIDPTNTDDKVHNAIDKASDCWYYYRRLKNISATPMFSIKITDKSFNTRERLKTYLDYDFSLKGRVFTSSIKTIDDCDVNINEID
jgi:methionine-rich copper-binding protein CopC